MWREGGFFGLSGGQKLVSGIVYKVLTCSASQYGRVERLFIDIENRLVFIKFTDQVSALRVRLPMVFMCVSGIGCPETKS